MRIGLILRVLVVVLTSSLSTGQMSTITVTKAVEDLHGPPKNPPIFSEMTVIMQGSLDYQDQDTIGLKGPIASVTREDSRQASQNPHAFPITTTFNFDDSGHLVGRTVETPTSLVKETALWKNSKLQRQESLLHASNGKGADRSDWNEWSYDKNGHLSEFHSGEDKVAFTSLVNFKYDSKNRLLGYELLAREVVEISYVGNQITQSTFRKGENQKLYEQIQTLDAEGRVADLRVCDMSGGKLTLWYHVAFKYDEKGRVIQQQTDPFKLGSGDDYSPIPGKLMVEYNDEKQSGEQKFYDTDGKLALHTKFAYDRDGALTKLCVVDSSGKDVVGGETFTDAQYKSNTRPGSLEWEVIYDDHDNWTERRRWFTPADGSPKIMTRLIRQTITYR